METICIRLPPLIECRDYGAIGTMICALDQWCQPRSIDNSRNMNVIIIKWLLL